MNIHHTRRDEPMPIRRPWLAVYPALFVTGLWIRLGRHAWLIVR